MKGIKTQLSWSMQKKIQHPLMIKTIRKLGREGHFLNMIKSLYLKKLAGNIIHNGERLKEFPLKSV